MTKEVLGPLCGFAFTVVGHAEMFLTAARVGLMKRITAVFIGLGMHWKSAPVLSLWPFSCLQYISRPDSCAVMRFKHGITVVNSLQVEIG